jgi:large subunit ribosomal protein L18
MKLSKRTLLKLKNKNKKLKPNKYKKLKREALRGNVKGTLERPRLSVYRSNEHIYAQIIDDTNSKTLLSCSTLDRSVRLSLSTGRTCDASRLMGEKLAELSLKKYYQNCFRSRSLFVSWTCKSISRWYTGRRFTILNSNLSINIQIKYIL